MGDAARPALEWLQAVAVDAGLGHLRGVTLDAGERLLGDGSLRSAVRHPVTEDEERPAVVGS